LHYRSNPLDFAIVRANLSNVVPTGGCEGEKEASLREFLSLDVMLPLVGDEADGVTNVPHQAVKSSDLGEELSWNEGNGVRDSLLKCMLILERNCGIIIPVDPPRFGTISVLKHDAMDHIAHTVADADGRVVDSGSHVHGSPASRKAGEAKGPAPSHAETKDPTRRL